MSIKRVQQMLLAAGHEPGPIDGKWGSKTELALATALGRRPDFLAWGSKISEAAREKVIAISERLGCDPSDLMACMAWESGESFDPSIVNRAGSGATGLIQFMPATAKGMGTSTSALSLMTVEAQLDWVEEYFRPYRGKLKTIGDLYMAILWPAGVGKPEGFVLWDKATRPTTYRQNAGIDINKDGTITKAEATAKVQAKLVRGLLPEFRA